VIPHIAPITRTVAIDLIGFGKSDKPLDINYDLPTYARYFEGVIDALRLKNPISGKNRLKAIFMLPLPGGAL
jgi:haloalkane dehalogenase